MLQKRLNVTEMVKKYSFFSSLLAIYACVFDMKFMNVMPFKGYCSLLNQALAGF